MKKTGRSTLRSGSVKMEEMWGGGVRTDTVVGRDGSAPRLISNSVRVSEMALRAWGPRTGERVAGRVGRVGCGLGRFSRCPLVRVGLAVQASLAWWTWPGGWDIVQGTSVEEP